MSAQGANKCTSELKWLNQAIKCAFSLTLQIICRKCQSFGELQGANSWQLQLFKKGRRPVTRSDRIAQEGILDAPGNLWQQTHLFVGCRKTYPILVDVGTINAQNDLRDQRTSSKQCPPRLGHQTHDKEERSQVELLRWTVSGI